MSVSVRILMGRRVPSIVWHGSLDLVDLEWSPHTVGQNAYYGPAGSRLVEVIVNAEGSVGKHADDREFETCEHGYRFARWDWATAAPPEYFTELTVGTVYPAAHATVATIANRILKVYGSSYGARLAAVDAGVFAVSEGAVVALDDLVWV